MSKKPTVALTDAERFPLLSDFSFLSALKQDPVGPRFNFQSGDRLKSNHLQKLKDYAKQLRGGKEFWIAGATPDWLSSYVDWCKRTVPFYSDRPDSFLDQPTISRLDIKQNAWKFVSHDCDLDDLLVYQTSGTTGTPIEILFDPFSQALSLPQLQSVLDAHKIQLTERSGTVAIAVICAQQSALTYASLSTYLNGAGVVKINLNPAEWNDPNDRITFLEKHNPEVLTGDPFAFIELLELRPRIRPKAMVSSAVKLTQGVREKLENYFQCLVVDIYSLTECKMVAVEEQGRYKAIRPELYFEIFDKDKDFLLPRGERGELVITGGLNPFLPLIRYRTGDFCRLTVEEGIPYLVDLEARIPVILQDYKGRFVNYVDVSKLLSVFSMGGYTLHQSINKKIIFKGWGESLEREKIEHALKAIFGESIGLEVSIENVAHKSPSKPIAYSSDLLSE